MSGAREGILSAIRTTLARQHGPAPDPAAIAADAARLHARAHATVPALLPGTPAEAFLARVTSAAIGATGEFVASLQDLPQAVRRYLAAHGLPETVALQPHPELGQLDWQGIATHGEIDVNEPVAVGLARGGIAETGTLVFHSDASSPTLFLFLPLHHIVAVRADTIWPWLEDYAAAFAGQPAPRNVNLVTGASGTTDIEGTLVRGAHGPGWLHILVVGATIT